MGRWRNEQKERTAIQVHRGPSRSIEFHRNPSRSIEVHRGPPRPIVRWTKGPSEAADVQTSGSTSNSRGIRHHRRLVIFNRPLYTLVQRFTKTYFDNLTLYCNVYAILYVCKKSSEKWSYGEIYFLKFRKTQVFVEQDKGFSKERKKQKNVE